MLWRWDERAQQERQQIPVREPRAQLTAVVCLEDDLMQGTRAEDDSDGGGKAADGERGGDVCAESSSEFSLSSG